MYSKAWQDKINELESHQHTYKWEDVINYFKAFPDFDLNNSNNTVVLPEGIWVQVSDLEFSKTKFRKVKAITHLNVYYDGAYSNLYSSFSLGSLYHKFTLDGKTLDLTDVENPIRQQKLLDFLTMPIVPKGILKI